MKVHKSLWEALLAVQANAPALPKDGINPHYKSRYTTLDTIVEVVGKLLNEHGLVWSTLPSVDPQSGDPALKYKLVHAATGETEEGLMPLLASKLDPQAQGSAITYARRYSLTAVLNLCTDEDDDGNQARRRPEPKPFGNEFDKAAMGAMIGAACTSMASGDAEKGRALYASVTKDCGGYMPMAAALAIVQCAEAVVRARDVEGPAL